MSDLTWNEQNSAIMSSFVPVFFLLLPGRGSGNENTHAMSEGLNLILEKMRANSIARISGNVCNIC